MVISMRCLYSRDQPHEKSWRGGYATFGISGRRYTSFDVGVSATPEIASDSLTYVSDSNIFYLQLGTLL